MKTRKLLLHSLYILAFCSISVTLSAQTTAKELSEQMTRGINLGNTFDASGYEGAWAPAAKESYFDAYKEEGFTCVRIPITWQSGVSETDASLRFDSVAPYKINKTFLARLDEVVNWSLSRGLITVINVHHDEWLKHNEEFDANKERFYALWEQLSKHYKDYSHDLVFEILNEPQLHIDGVNHGLTQPQLDELNIKALSIIRKYNPTRVAIYTGRTWATLWDLKKTGIPDKNDKYLMGTYHSYTPWPYAGEGKGSWGTAEDRAAMEDEFKVAKAYTDSTGMPVFIGEYGAQHKCEYNSRMQHYAYYVENIQKYKIASAVWDDGGHLWKTLDRTTGVWDDVKDILVNYSPQSPDNIQLTIQDGNAIQISWNSRAENIKNTTVEKRAGRKGAFKSIGSVDKGVKYVDKAEKENQTDYYYRVVQHLSDGSALISYPQRVYIP